mmetsp:Transcript_13940/g.20806  ORF Transcript_13940/g.20806 Transcript_13940/m.20806 type:complete len:88 (-) Transcript_13940:127-390(-)
MLGPWIWNQHRRSPLIASVSRVWGLCRGLLEELNANVYWLQYNYCHQYSFQHIHDKGTHAISLYCMDRYTALDGNCELFYSKIYLEL